MYDTLRSFDCRTLSNRLFVLWLWPLLLVFGLILSAPAVKAAPLPTSFAPLVKELLPSVVNIRASNKSDAAPAQDGQQGPRMPQGLEDFFREFGIPMPNLPNNPNQPSTALGSGFVIDDTGILVTNNHVIDGADEVFVTLQSGEEFVAELVGTDPKTDIAVLKIDTDGFPLKAVPFGDSDQSEVGDWVLAIGNPLGSLGGSVTAGIISARGRNINSGPYDDFIQTDAAINRGNSGGPLFNTRGEVIGINTIILSPNGGSIGIGFSIPSNLASRVIDQLIRFGSTRRGWLGVLIQDINPEMAESLGDPDLKGALVSQVTPGGPAEAAGLEVGDLIVGFDGHPVDSSRSLPILVAETPVGKEVVVKLIRGGSTMKVDVVLGQLEKAEQSQLASNPAPTQEPEEVRYVLGLQLGKITRKLTQRFELDPYAEGLVIVGVEPDSRAAQIRVVPGMVVARVNQRSVTTLEDFEEILEEARDKGRENILLLIKGKQGSRFLTLPLAEE